MAVGNTIVKQQKPKFTVAISSDSYKKMINNTLGSPQRAARFVTAITSAVSNNPALQECEVSTVVSAGLLGESLNLTPSPQLGQYYLVPFKDRKNNRTVAQFQLGYKGYIQLAIRSGYYKKINVLPIKESELIRYDPLEEEIKVQLIEDEEMRENAQTVGYYAMFEYLNGFKKTLYWSRAKMESHAERYSMGYKAHKGYTFWEKDFDGMACKTMLRQLISKWGIMSVEMQKAFDSDAGVIDNDGNVNYVDAPVADIQSDNQPIDIPAEPEQNSEEYVPMPPEDDFSAIMEG